MVPMTQPAAPARAAQQVLGMGVLARMRANASIVGDQIVQTALSRVGKELRHEIEALTPLAWIDLDRVERVQDAIAIEAHVNPESLHDQAIRRAQEESIRTVYRIVLGLASDAWLVSRTQLMYRKTRRIGQLRSVISSPGEASLTLTEWPGIRDRYVRQVSLGAETLLTLTGRKDVTSRYTRRPDGADIEVQWTPK